MVITWSRPAYFLVVSIPYSCLLPRLKKGAYNLFVTVKIIELKKIKKNIILQMIKQIRYSTQQKRNAQKHFQTNKIEVLRTSSASHSLKYSENRTFCRLLILNSLLKYSKWRCQVQFHFHKFIPVSNVREVRANKGIGQQKGLYVK